jgi:pyrroloquinoline quinone biosynthesis protein B
MRVRLLGTAAGGGFPQWNCRCTNCRGVRAGTLPASPRTQSSVAVSADERSWFLLNASPDVRAQIESFAPLLPGAGIRGTGIAGVLLTNADLDHSLGLLLLREGGPVDVHATAEVRQALDEGVKLTALLDYYGGLRWHELPAELVPLRGADGAGSGLLYAAFTVPGKPPRYRERRIAPFRGDTVGLRLVDERTGGRLVYVPGVAALDGVVLGELRACDALLLDGTFFSDGEMQAEGVGALGARQMGHLPVGGSEGSLAVVATLPARRKVYVHINNTNPILREGSPQQREVAAAGAEVGYDCLELIL